MVESFNWLSFLWAEECQVTRQRHVRRTLSKETRQHWPCREVEPQVQHWFPLVVLFFRRVLVTVLICKSSAHNSIGLSTLDPNWKTGRVGERLTRKKQPPSITNSEHTKCKAKNQSSLFRSSREHALRTRFFCGTHIFLQHCTAEARITCSDVRAQSSWSPHTHGLQFFPNTPLRSVQSLHVIVVIDVWSLSPLATAPTLASKIRITCPCCLCLSLSLRAVHLPDVHQRSRVRGRVPPNVVTGSLWQCPLSHIRTQGLVRLTMCQENHVQEITVCSWRMFHHSCWKSAPATTLNCATSFSQEGSMSPRSRPSLFFCSHLACGFRIPLGSAAVRCPHFSSYSSLSTRHASKPKRRGTKGTRD